MRLCVYLIIHTTMGTSQCKTGSTKKTQIPRMQRSSDELLTKEVAFY